MPPARPLRGNRGERQEKMLGTILPTQKSAECNRAFAERESGEKEESALRAGLKGGINGGGETRYYHNNTYAIIGRDMRPKWFAIAPDGDYRIKDPRTV